MIKRRSEQNRERERANDWRLDLSGAVLKQATSAARISRGPSSMARISRRPTFPSASRGGQPQRRASRGGRPLPSASRGGHPLPTRISSGPTSSTRISRGPSSATRISRAPSSSAHISRGPTSGGRKIYWRPSSATPMATPRRNFPKGWPGPRIGPMRRHKMWTNRIVWKARNAA